MPDPVTGLVVAGTTLIGGAIQSSAAGKAAAKRNQEAGRSEALKSSVDNSMRCKRSP
jgi:hypothetical protein